MCAKFYPHIIEGIVPFRVMIHFFRDECNSSHESEGFLKTGKSKFTNKFVILFFPHVNQIRVQVKDN